jgi:A/G-specific adenine glycosylase
MLNNKSRFHSQLLSWYHHHQRDLPWRRTNDPYLIWVSEIMLQQTQVKTVIPYYQRFIERFPAISDLAQAELHDVLKLWEGLGYYSRARNLQKAAKLLLAENRGTIPADPEQLIKLPGVGEYTRAAILSIAFKVAVAAVDGNVKRVYARLLKVAIAVNGSQGNRAFKHLAEDHLYEDDPGNYNQALMELGAMICKPQEPDCDRCPVSDHCSAYQSGCVSGFPMVVPRPKTPTYHIAVGIVMKEERMLITRRAEKGLLGGLWEFPGGKIEKGEQASAACTREIREETSLNSEPVTRLTQVRHAYSHFKIIMEVFICRYLSGEVNLAGPTDFRWITLDQLDTFPFPKANLKFVPLLRSWVLGKQTG